jgi:plastocyanin
MSLSFSLSRRTLMTAGLLALAAIASSTPSFADTVTITISNFSFTPQQTKVAAGTTVVFKNGDDTIHSVIADDGSFHSQALDTNDEYSFTFAKAGVFSYHCGLHPFMQGTITVQ